MPRITLAAVVLTSLIGTAILAPMTMAVAVDAPAAVDVDGTIISVSDVGSQPGVPGVSKPVAGSARALLVTDSGTYVPLEEVPAGATSGSEFSGLVELPAEVATSLDLHPGDVLEADSADGEAAIEETGAADAPVGVREFDLDLPVAGSQVGAAHRLEVAVVTPSGTNPIAKSDGAIQSTINQAAAYWIAESNGTIASMNVSQYQRYNSQYSCDDVEDMWAEASARFGHGGSADRYFEGSGRHLVLLTPGECEGGAWGLGVGSVNSNPSTIHMGGVVYVADVLDTLLPTLAHELGHNIGLDHSNVREYDDPASGGDAGGFVDYEYEGLYSVMTGSWIGHPTPAVLPLGARAYLGFDTSRSAHLGLVEEQPTKVYPFRLSPAGSAGQYNAATLIDPISGTRYNFEYRNGTGRDAGAAYAASEFSDACLPSCPWGAGSGVHITRAFTRDTNGDGAGEGVATIGFSLAPDPALPAMRELALDAGEAFVSRGGGTTIRVINADASGADVEATLTTWNRSDEAPDVSRIAGADRFAAAVNISKAGYPATAPVVYLTTGLNYPDALSAAPAAVKEGGPLLLTQPTQLPTVVSDEIARLQPSKIVIVGGPNSVAPSIESALQGLSWAPEVVRLGGADRFEASRNIVEYAFAPGSVSTAYVATGLNFPDALSASGAGGALNRPVLLVNGGQPSLDADTETLLAELGVTSVLIAGGPNSVSPGIEKDLASVAPVTRLTGPTRYQASVAINRAAFDVAADVYLATGANFPDALAGAALAGAKGSPLYVTSPTCVTAELMEDLVAFGTERVTLLGGPQSLPAWIAQLRSC